MSNRALGPQFVDLFHGTTGEAARRIDEEGIKASSDLGLVHLTTDQSMAEHYARTRAAAEDGYTQDVPAIVHVQLHAGTTEQGWFGPHHQQHRGDIPASRIKDIWHLDD